MRFTLMLLACWLVAMTPWAHSLESRADRQARRELMRELSQKVFPVVEFKDATLAECVTWLNQQGVLIEIAPVSGEERPPKTNDSTADPEPLRRPPVTLKLKAVPASEVVKYLANLTFTNIEARNGKLCFAPVARACSFLESWDGVPLAFFGEDAEKIAAQSKGGEKTPRELIAVQAHLEARGIHFAKGCFAIYSIESQQLIVRHSTEEVIDAIDDLIAEFEKKQEKGR